MYPRRFSRSIVSPQPNLKIMNFFFECRNTRYFCMLRQKLSDFRDVKELTTKVQLIFKNINIHKTLINKLRNQKSIKDQSENLLKVWAHQCECVVAQRLRRSQQMFCMYSRIWEERALNDFIRNLRLAFTRKGKRLFLSAVGISTFNWENNRISDNEMKKYLNDIEYIYKLKEETVCLDCKTKKSDHNTSVCKCGTSGILDPSKTYDDWSPFLEKNDLVVWRRLHESGSYEYKVFGTYDDVTAEDFLNVQIDTDYRRKWDTTAIALEVAETDTALDSNSDIIYWEMLWPRFFANRDYVFNRRYLVDKDTSTIIILSKSTEHSKYPKQTEKFRVEDYWSRMVIKPTKDMRKPGVEFSLTYYDNPGVNIPASITTWVAMKAMPDFLERLREATRGYRQYCLTEGVSQACKIIREQVAEDDEFLDFCSWMEEPIILSPAYSRRWSRKGRIPKAPERPDSNIKEIENVSSEVPTITTTSNCAKNDSYWKYLRPTYYFS